MKNFLLFIVSIVLLIAFSGISIIVAIVLILKGKAKDTYFREVAIMIDATGNVMCQYVLNAMFIKRMAYPFGKRYETISSVLGKNQRDKTLIWFGQLMCNILNKFEKNHCLNSIDK